MSGWLDRVGDWAQDYGWVIPTLAIGVLFGLALAFTVSPSRLESLAYMGTFAAAIAAFWSVSLNQDAQRRQNRREVEARRPNLVISQAAANDRTIEITFANLSQSAIHVQAWILRNDLESGFDGAGSVAGLMLQPGSTAACSLIRVDISNVEHRGVINFYFFYAQTGPMLHCVTLPFYSYHSGLARFAGISDKPQKKCDLLVLKQKLTPDVKNKNKRLYDDYHRAFMPDQEWL
jgi:hypothetical protein